MATAETKLTPLVTVIEQLRADNNASALMQDERDAKRDTMLVDINVELISIKDTILSTRDVITESLQSLVFPTESFRTEITTPIVQTITESQQSSTFPTGSIQSEITAPIVAAITSLRGPIISILEKMKSGGGVAAGLDTSSELIKWLQSLGNKIDTSNGALLSINNLSRKQVDLMEKAFNLQESESRAAAERAREAGRGGTAGAEAGAPEADAGGKKKGLLSKMFKGMGSAVLLPIKALFSAFSMIGKIFGGIGKFLLKPFKFLIGGLTSPLGTAIKIIQAMYVGLLAVAGLFAGLVITSMFMTDAEFADLTKTISTGVAGAISKTVKKAMEIWNSFAPESWKISPENMKAFEEGTFATVEKTITSVMEFAKELGDAFSDGFMGQMDGFKASWDSFMVIFDKIVSVFGPKIDEAAGEAGAAAKGGLLATASAVAAAVASIGKFFVDLLSALGLAALGEPIDTDSTVANTAAGIVRSIVVFIADLVESFGAGFSTKFKGISDQFTELKNKMGQVFDSIGVIMEKVGKGAAGAAGGSKSTLVGIFNFMGKTLGLLIESILSVANFIADMIIDPTVTFAKFQADIGNAFSNMGRVIADFFDDLFSKESIMKMLQGMLGEDSLMFKGIEKVFGSMEEVSAKAEEMKKKELSNLKEKNEIIKKSAAETQRQLKEALKKESSMRTEEEDAKVRNLQLALTRELGDIEINKGTIERLDERIKESQEIRIQEKVSDRMGEEGREQERLNAKKKNKIANLQKGTARLEEADIKAHLGGMRGETFSLKEFKGMMGTVKEMSGGKITAEMIAGGKAELTPKMIDQIVREFNIERKDIKGKEDAAKIFKAGMARLIDIDKSQGRVRKLQSEIDKTDLTLTKKRQDITNQERAKVEKKTKIDIQRSKTTTPAAATAAAVTTPQTATVKAAAVTTAETPVAQAAETIGEISDFNAQLMKFAQDEKFTPSEQKVTTKLIQESTDNKDKLREILFASPLMGMFQATKGSRKTSTAALSKDVIGRNFEQSIRQLQEGGLVTETGMAMLHGTVPKPELVLDNQAASLFMAAADKISMIPIPAAQSSGQVLTELQRAGSAAGAAGASVVVNNNAPTTTSINSSQPMVLPPSPIYAGNPENSRLDA